MLSISYKNPLKINKFDKNLKEMAQRSTDVLELRPPRVTKTIKTNK